MTNICFDALKGSTIFKIILGLIGIVTFVLGSEKNCLCEGDGLIGDYYTKEVYDINNNFNDQRKENINFPSWTEDLLPPVTQSVCHEHGAVCNHELKIIWRGYIELPEDGDYEIKLEGIYEARIYADANLKKTDIYALPTTEFFIGYTQLNYTNCFQTHSDNGKKFQCTSGNGITHTTTDGKLKFKISKQKTKIRNKKFYPISIYYIASHVNNQKTILSWKKPGEITFNPIPIEYLYSYLPEDSAVVGIFDAVDTDVNFQTSSDSNKVIKTKVIHSNFNLNFYLTNEDRDSLVETTNSSAGVFLYDEDKGIEVEFLDEYEFTSSSLTKTLNIDRAIKNARIKFKYCEDTSANWTHCWNSGLNGSKIENANYEPKYNHSTDNFAIRPKIFNVNLPDKDIKAGEEFELRVFALDGQNDIVTTYNESVPLKTELLIQKAGDHSCKLGDISPATLDFANGKFETLEAKYSEVGKILVYVKEDIGSEFALVDTKDTNEEDRLISSEVKEVMFNPYYFYTSNSVTQSDGEFVYYSDGPITTNEKKAQFYVGFTARNKDNNATINYDERCFPTETFMDLKFQKIDTDSHRGYINYSTDEKVDHKLRLAFESISLPLVFKESKAENSFDVNFSRDSRQAENPIKFSLQEVKLGEVDDKEVENLILPKTATFLYGRVFSPDARTSEDSYTASIYYEVYCQNLSLCSGYARNTGLNSDSFWYVNTARENTAKQVADIKTKKGGNDGLSNEASGIVKVTIKPDKSPSIVNIDFAVPQYLRYDKYNSNPERYNFEVEFLNDYIGVGNWGGTGYAGEDDPTGSVLDFSGGTIRPNERIRY